MAAADSTNGMVAAFIWLFAVFYPAACGGSQIPKASINQQRKSLAAEEPESLPCHANYWWLSNPVNRLDPGRIRPIRVARWQPSYRLRVRLAVHFIHEHHRRLNIVTISITSSAVPRSPTHRLPVPGSIICPLLYGELRERESPTGGTSQ